jgi:hypothetical protein
MRFPGGKDFWLKNPLRNVASENGAFQVRHFHLHPCPIICLFALSRPNSWLIVCLKKQQVLHPRAVNVSDNRRYPYIPHTTRIVRTFDTAAFQIVCCLCWCVIMLHSFLSVQWGGGGGMIVPQWPLRAHSVADRIPDINRSGTYSGSKILVNILICQLTFMDTYSWKCWRRRTKRYDSTS